jgi:hypothetical protein
MADNINRMTLVFRGVHDRGGRNAVPILSAAAIRPNGSLTSMCAQTNMDTRLLVLHLKKTHFGFWRVHHGSKESTVYPM